MSSSEDVLLMVSHVSHKKVAGTMYLMNERVAWMPNGKDTFTISHRYADIKMQKISPEGKAKVQLQVVLHNGENTTFHFVNPAGTPDQLQDRNGVKELLQQLLPKFKRKINKELEEKNNILSNDPVLYQLYRDLVVTQVITADEFWANYVKKPAQESSQETGISGSFLIGIAPQTDGSCGIRYNITPEIIDSIFRTYPAVKRKHLENVPHSLSEGEFWTKFFQSHYFHRDRLTSGHKDLFSECARTDEQDVRRAIERGIPDPFVDVAAFREDREEERSSGQVQNTQKEINQNMIRRFNHHSMMVLQSCTSSASKAAAAQQNGASCSSDKKQLVESKTNYDDLRPAAPPSVNPLNLTKVARYLSGPVPIQEGVGGPSVEDLVLCAEAVSASLVRWRPDLPATLTPSSAIVALGDMMPGGALMKNMDGTALRDQVPPEIQTELKALYCALGELLRHFWCCFPTATPQLEEKAANMHHALQRFEYVKLQPFQEKLVRSCLPSNLCDHLRSLLNAAYKKFANWQARRGR